MNRRDFVIGVGLTVPPLLRALADEVIV